jgi:hypothetical protein
MVSGPHRAALPWRLVEWLAVLASPAALFFLLRLQGMATPELPDPSMHTTFIIDPRAIFTRYAAAFASTARMREGAQVAFLVPARLAYLLFGAVGGFFAFRYVLALAAVVPAYLLLKRLYGRWAGFLAIALVMSNPVFVMAWGTDYPDSAAISYLTGGLCSLVMPSSRRVRPVWLVAAGGFFALAIWSHGAAVPIVAASLVAYAIVRLLRARRDIIRDALVIAASAAGVTGLLSILSKLELGQWNFITPTLQAERFLSRPTQEALWHSTNWRWVLYDPYLLILPATLVAFYVVFARRYREIGDVPLFFALAGLFVFGVAGYLQFIGKVQTLEVHFLSSLQWSMVILLLALVLAEMTAPALAGDPRERRSVRLGSAASGALPALVVVTVALAYETDPHVPAIGLSPGGILLAVVIVALVALWRILLPAPVRGSGGPSGSSIVRLATSLIFIVAIVGAALVLTVAPRGSMPQLLGVVDDPPQLYASTLGGSDAFALDEYKVTSELPAFVGQPAYKGEQLLMWWPFNELGYLLGPIGIYHANFDTVHGATFGVLGAAGKQELATRRPAQILLLSRTGQHFSGAVRQLRPYQPTVVRRAVLSDGGYRIHIWLIDLGRYYKKTG